VSDGGPWLSKVFCYSPELGKCSLVLGYRRLHRTIQVVRDVIMDLSMVFLDRLELLGKLEAGPVFLDHGDDLVEVSVRPLEVLDEPGCTRCVMVFLTISILPPGYSYPPGWIAKAA
jgi:hypothetical protein